jgi:hypothetical protein
VVVAQGSEHVSVVIGVEDAFDDRVEAVIQAVAGRLVDEADVRAARDVALAQDGAAKVILADNRDAPPVTLAYPGGHGALSRRRVAPDEDEPGACRAGGGPHGAKLQSVTWQ